MNGIFANILISLCILHHWRGRDHLRLWLTEMTSILEALDARAYDLSLLVPRAEPSQLLLIRALQHILAKGCLHPEHVRSLLAHIRRLQQEDQERQRLGLSAVIRLSLGSCLALFTSLALDRSWNIDIQTNPPALLLLLSQGLISFMWLQRLPGHPLAKDAPLQLQLTEAWLGDATAGPWQQKLEEVTQRGWIQGRDPTGSRRQILLDWWHEAQGEQQKQLTWAEELFSIVELACSVYFLGTVCALPLLRHFA